MELKNNEESPNCVTCEFRVEFGLVDGKSIPVCQHPELFGKDNVLTGLIENPTRDFYLSMFCPLDTKRLTNESSAIRFLREENDKLQTENERLNRRLGVLEGEKAKLIDENTFRLEGAKKTNEYVNEQNKTIVNLVKTIKILSEMVDNFEND